MSVKFQPKVIAVAFTCACWTSAVAFGMYALWSYSNRPGSSGAGPQEWPVASRILRAPDAPTLLMFLHPRCPCSRASIGELARLMRDAHGLVDARVVFFRPAQSAADWHETDLWQSAAAIPGVSLELDADAVEAKRFGAVTSGAALLYDEQGRLRFSGGITTARGHAGDNLGRDSVLAILRGEPGSDRSAVYGCAIVDPAVDESPGAEDESCRQ